MAGRPKAKIDWKKVDNMLIAGCTGTEVAANIGVHPETLYDACQEEYKTHFSEYSRQKKEKGFTMLKQKRFQIAMTGDNSMIMFLSKVMMGESEKQTVEVNAKTEVKHIPSIDEIVAKLKEE